MRNTGVMAYDFKGRDGGLRKLQMDYVTGFYAMRNAIDSLATGGGTLTTAFEGTMTASTKQAGEMAAQLGMTGAEAEKFSKSAANMAYSLNLGVDEAGKAIDAFTRQGVIFRKLGLENASSVAQFAKVAGVDVKQLAGQFRLMTNNLGLSEEQIDSIIGSFQKMGEVTRDVPGSFNMIADITAVLQRQQGVLRTTFTDQESLTKATAGFAKQTAAVAAGLYDYTSSAEAARKMAMGLAEGLTISRENFQKLLGGLPGGIEQLERLATAVGVDNAKEMLSKGPMGFLKDLFGILQGKDPASAIQTLDVFSAHLKAAFGDEFVNTVMAAAAQGGTALTKVMKSMESVQDANDANLNGLRSMYKDGLTFQERVERQFVEFQQKIRGYAGSERNYLETRKKGFNELSTTLDNMRRQGGFLAELPTMLANVNKYGLAGVFGEETAAKVSIVGDALKALQGPLQAMYSSFMALQTLLSPGGLLFAGMAAFGTIFAANFMKFRGDFDRAMDGTLKDIEGMATSLNGKLQEIGRGLTSWFATGKAKIFFDSVLANAKKVLTSFTTVLKTLTPGISSFLISAASVIKETLVTAINTLSSSEMGGVLEAIVDMGSAVLGAMWDFIGRLVADPRVGKAFDGLVGSILKGATSIFSKVNEWLSKPETQERIAALSETIGKITATVLKFIIDIFSKDQVKATFRDLINIIVKSFTGAVWEMVKDIFTWENFKNLLAGGTPLAGAIAGGLKGGAMGLASAGPAGAVVGTVAGAVSGYIAGDAVVEGTGVVSEFFTGTPGSAISRETARKGGAVDVDTVVKWMKATKMSPDKVAAGAIIDGQRMDAQKLQRLADEAVLTGRKEAFELLTGTSGEYELRLQELQVAEQQLNEQIKNNQLTQELINGQSRPIRAHPTELNMSSEDEAPSGRYLSR